MNINSGDAKLVLLCPAWKKWGTAKTVKPGTVILHWYDVSLANLSKKLFAQRPSQILVWEVTSFFSHVQGV